jgi:murein DD-endopeptidase MepM/ murein hydrolase activator NlpD
MRKRLATGLILIVLAIIILPDMVDNASYSGTGSDKMKEFDDPVIIGFPLRGEWTAPTTPGKRIPSHGTDQLGERYAFDFVRVDWARTGKPFYQASLPQYLFSGVPLNKCYGWGQGVYAPCDGEIIKAEDGYKERQRVHWFSDSSVALKNAYTFNPGKDDIQTVAGNYIVMKCADHVYAAFAHLQAGSITVSAGQVVRKGDVLGKVGHSGNSTAPHLHFQLMDSSDWRSAKGIPCAFEQYELSQDGQWETVYKGVPSDKDRIRFEP